VPCHESAVARFLHEQARAPAENVRPEYRLDRIENARIEDELIEPRELEMPLVADDVPCHQPGVALECLDVIADIGGLVWREARHGKDVPIAVVG